MPDFDHMTDIKQMSAGEQMPVSKQMTYRDQERPKWPIHEIEEKFRCEDHKMPANAKMPANEHKIPDRDTICASE